MIGAYIYRRVHHLPTGDCAYCAKVGQKKKSRLLMDYEKKYHPEH